MSGCPFHSPLPTDGSPRPPGSRGRWGLGQFGAFVRDLRGFVTSRRRRLGPVFWAHVYGRDTVFVSSATANRWVFAGEHDYLRKDWPLAWRKLAGRRAQTVVTDPQEHDRLMSVMRQALAPTAAVAGVQRQVIRRHLERWVGASAIDPYVDFKRVALHADAEAILGVRFEDDTCDEIMAEFRQMVRGFSCRVPIALPPFPFARAMASRRRLQRVFGRIVDQQLTEIRDGVACLVNGWRRVGGSHRHALGVILTDALEHDRLDAEELRDQFQILIFAGHEFPGAAIINACLELLRHPPVLARLRDDVDRLAVEWSLEELREASYLDAFVDEVLRMHPPVPGGYRMLTRDASLEGYRLPRGWRVKFEPFLSHFEEQYWREPLKFDPQRFLAPRAEHLRHRGAYVPFGGGARACPGARYGLLFIKSFLVELVRAYELAFEGTPSLESAFGHVYQPHYSLRLAPRRTAARVVAA